MRKPSYFFLQRMVFHSTVNMISKYAVHNCQLQGKCYDKKKHLKKTWDRWQPELHLLSICIRGEGKKRQQERSKEGSVAHWRCTFYLGSASVLSLWLTRIHTFIKKQPRVIILSRDSSMHYSQIKLNRNPSWGGGIREKNNKKGNCNEAVIFRDLSNDTDQ